MVNLLDLFPPRPTEMSPPSLGSETTLEVFHSLIDADDEGTAVVAMRRPAPHAAPFTDDDDYTLRDVARNVWFTHGDRILDGTLAYTWALVPLPRGVVAVYVTPLLTRLSSEVLH